MNITALIYTYNRVDDARINMEIIRNQWAKEPGLNNVKIVHSYNGKGDWYEQYIEDKLVTTANTRHFSGAANLIDAGHKTIAEYYPETDYVIVLAADTWLVKPEYIMQKINELKEKSAYLATCPWGFDQENDYRSTGVATDFFIYAFQWANQNNLFPIDYLDFEQRYEDLFYYLGQSILLERVFLAKFGKTIVRQSGEDNGKSKQIIQRIVTMEERIPVHHRESPTSDMKRTFYVPSMGLISNHNPEDKQEIIKPLNILGGSELARFITATDLNYYNAADPNLHHFYD